MQTIHTVQEVMMVLDIVWLMDVSISSAVQPILIEGSAALCNKAVAAESLAALGKLVQKQVSPMRSTVTASNYRRQVASVLAQRLLGELSAP